MRYLQLPAKKTKNLRYFVPACIRHSDIDVTALHTTSGHDVTFYYDFHGFLNGLLTRVCCREVV